MGKLPSLGLMGKLGVSRRRFLRTSGSVIAAGAAARTLGPWDPAYAQAPAGELIAAMYQDPQGLDPQLSIQTESFQAMLACFEQLYDYNPHEDAFYPQIAADWPDVSDPLNVVIQLRDDVVFHDGTPLTAEDVADTFNFVLDTGPASPAYGLYGSIDRVEVQDPHTVVFRMQYPYGLLVNYLSSIMGGIVKKGARDSVDLARAPIGVGSGPFEFVEWVQGSHLTFKAFPGYFRPDVPGVERLTYRILKEDATRVAQLVGGRINFLDEPPKRDFAQLIARDDIEGERGLSEKVGYVMLNHLHPVTGNVHIRRALSFATDRQAILDAVYEGYGVPAHGPMKPGTWWYDPDVEALASLDLEKARAEISASGLSDVTFDLMCENNTHHVDSSTLLQAMWSEVGINANVVPMEKTAFYERCAKDKADWAAGYTDWSSSVYTPDYMIKLVFKSDGSYRRVNYSDPEVDGWIEQAQRTSSEEEQKVLFSQIQTRMADDVASLWIAWYDWTPAWRSNVKGFKAAPTYYDYFDHVTVENG